MAHYSNEITQSIQIRYVGNGAKFYPYAPNNSSPFNFAGTSDELYLMLREGDFVLVGNQNIDAFDNTLVPGSPNSAYLDYVEAYLVAFSLAPFFVSNGHYILDSGTINIVVH